MSPNLGQSYDAMIAVKRYQEGVSEYAHLPLIRFDWGPFWSPQLAGAIDESARTSYFAQAAPVTGTNLTSLFHASEVDQRDKGEHILL